MISFDNTSEIIMRCLLLATLINSANCFTTMNPAALESWSKLRAYSTSSRISMVRNIDLPETLIFYGRHVLLEDDNETPKYGLLDLLKECKDIETPAILIDDFPNGEESSVAPLPKELDDESLLQVFPVPNENQQQTGRPPNPRLLVDIMESTTIDPKGFGGSSGFGRKLADPPRSPLPQYVIVFGDCEDVCRAARYTGMRVFSIGTESDLADAVADDFGFYLDEIATPGSFWINTSNPRDDEGNKVDTSEIIDWYESQITMENSEKNQEGNHIILETSPSLIPGEDEAEEPLDEDEIARILADLDSL
mmetsp:Transcript_23826/g.33310  ORF Transcript_23826/g.33310 Transcript_23826/m.33310 type:complete len:308 (-) Transcript_23826:260-1183(-)